MPVCAKCGRQLPAGDLGDLCAECRVASPSPTSRWALRRPDATLALIGLNLLVFLAMVASGVPVLHPSSGQILRWGADYGPFTLSGQWWRLLTNIFVHIGLLHLALNMWCLFDLGYLAENLYGRWTFLAIYLFTGLSGSLASLIRDPSVVSAGASGAIFGVAGALITTLYLGHVPLPRHSRHSSLVSLIVFAGYNLAYGFLRGGIDNGAHLGGLASGLLLGVVLSRDFRAPSRPHWRFRPLLFPALALALLVPAAFLQHANLSLILANDAETSLRRGNTREAIAQLSHAIQINPNDAHAYTLLGAAYLMNKQDAQAEAAFNRVLQLRPRDTDARRQLAVLYLKSGRVDDAFNMYQQIAQQDPKAGDAFYNMGLILKRKGRNDEALAAFQRVVALNPNLAPAQFNLGLMYMSAKKYDEAIVAFQNTARLLPNDPDAQLWLGNAYQAKGMTREADAAFQKAYSLRRPRARR